MPQGLGKRGREDSAELGDGGGSRIVDDKRVELARALAGLGEKFAAEQGARPGGRTMEPLARRGAKGCEGEDGGGARAQQGSRGGGGNTSSRHNSPVPASGGARRTSRGPAGGSSCSRRGSPAAVWQLPSGDVSTPSRTPLSTPPTTAGLPVSAPQGQGGKGVAGNRELEEKEEYTGVEKVEGDNTFKCRLNPNLRFKSAHEAAWGHDIIVLGSAHERKDLNLDAGELNFAQHVQVTQRLVQVVTSIFNQTVTANQFAQPASETEAQSQAQVRTLLVAATTSEGKLLTECVAKEDIIMAKDKQIKELEIMCKSHGKKNQELEASHKLHIEQQEAAEKSHKKEMLELETSRHTLQLRLAEYEKNMKDMQEICSRAGAKST